MSYDVLTPSVARLWPYAPDWSAGFQVTRSYLTDIITARDGTEQRRATRDQPRLSAAYRTVVTGADRRAADHYLRARQDMPAVIPDFARWARLTGSSAAGTSTLTISPVPVWIAAGQPLVLCQSGITELVNVIGVAGSTVTVDDPLVNNWASGDVVRPSFFGLLNGKMNSARPNRDAADYDVELACYPGGEPARDAGTAWATVAGIEVFTPQPDFASPPRIDDIWPVEQVDYGRGRTAQFRPIALHARGTDAAFNGLSLAEATALEQFFDRMKGRRTAFYLPTWEQDFVLNASALSGSSSIHVQGTDLNDDFGSIDYATVTAGIVVCLKDGTTIYRRITDISDGGTDSIIAVNAAWGSALSTSNVARISRMDLVRFNNEDMETSWRTPLAAGAQLSFLGVSA
jgi:hypothetical protein